MDLDKEEIFPASRSLDDDYADDDDEGNYDADKNGAMEQKSSFATSLNQQTNKTVRELTYNIGLFMHQHAKIFKDLIHGYNVLLYKKQTRCAKLILILHSIENLDSLNND